MRLRLILIPLAVAAYPAAAQAPDIVVTGGGLPVPAAERVYGAVEIGRDRLAGSAGHRLEDVLRDVPGFQLFRRSDSRSANPTSQGATLRALGGNASSRALLVLDGVPQADPFGGWIAWPALDPRRLGSARILRGGGSGANGPGALAGTIELASADAGDARGAFASLAYGSRDSLDAYARIGLPAGGGFLSLSGAWARGDGFVPVIGPQRGAIDRPAPYRQTSLSVRAVAPLGSGLELQANGLWFTDARERGTALSEVRSEGADASFRLVGRRWSALGYLQTRDFYTSFASVNAARTTVLRTAEQYAVPATGLGARAELRPRLGPLELRLGGDWRETEGRTEERFQFVAGTGTRGRIAGGRTRTLGGFAEAALERGPLTLTGGGRLDRWTIRGGTLREQVFATGALATDAAFPDRAGWEPTGRFGLAVHAAPAVTLRAAGYLGWRLPTLNELYRPFRVGPDATAANAALLPERLRGIEAGAELRPAAGLRFAVTLFSNRLEGAIANVTLGQGPGTFPGVGFVAVGGDFRQRRNLDAIRSDGAELDVRVERGAWSLVAGYSFADARIRASGAAAPLDGLRPAQTPRHSLSAAFAWRGADGAAGSLAARWTAGQYEDDLNRQFIPSALTLDAAASLPLGRRLALEARAENLTGERVVAGISGAGIVERASPRTLWIGLRWRS
ncbi:MAG TPA: TonB-dependent receptor [Allosphingosinicella sp.]|nr:TonB-dependent receptor [Allosphingosinicella sp.]HYG29147.1 TonB-dependent receptor [Allosphingosinicella sp.]